MAYSIGFCASLGASRTGASFVTPGSTSSKFNRLEGEADDDFESGTGSATNNTEPTRWQLGKGQGSHCRANRVRLQDVRTHVSGGDHAAGTATGTARV